MIVQEAHVLALENLQDLLHEDLPKEELLHQIAEAAILPKIAEALLLPTEEIHLRQIAEILLPLTEETLLRQEAETTEDQLNLNSQTALKAAC